jgi:hypothetical protein
VKPSGAIEVAVGADVQALVNGAPTGATFWFAPGVHRVGGIVPKSNQVFLGADGAVLSGAKLVTSFSQEGGYFVASGQTQQGVRHATENGSAGAERAGYPDAFYLDNHPLKPVDALSKVVPGTFYFDYDADKVYFKDNPAGHTVEAAVAPSAFSNPSATGVTIQNLTLEKYASIPQHGAIEAGAGWVVRNNDIRLNYGAGVVGHNADDAQFIGNHIHDNGQLGIGGTGARMLVEGNEIDHNGIWSGIDPGWEAGGAKWALTTDLVVRGNFSHENRGPGLWTDINNYHTVYENNVVVSNTTAGIKHEISYDAVIRNNTIMGNGTGYGSPSWLWGGQIEIQNSKNVEVYGNRIDSTGDGYGNGIMLLQQNRGSGTRGVWETTGNQIHDNTIVSRELDGASGGVADYNNARLFTGGNVFANNHYYVTNAGSLHWAWNDGLRSFAGIQAAGQEKGSTVSTALPDTSAWLPSAPTPIR